MANGGERTKQVTIKATFSQHARWETAAHSFHGGLQSFLALAADLFARRLREIYRERAKTDPIEQRLHEKTLLGHLLTAARTAVDHLPTHVDGLYGRTYPKRDLQRAIEGVRTFLRETGDQYGE